MNQPRIVLEVLKGGKPHQPVKTIVIWGNDTGTPVDATWLTLELKLHPLSLSVHCVIPGALEDYFRALLSDAVCVCVCVCVCEDTRDTN